MIRQVEVVYEIGVLDANVSPDLIDTELLERARVEVAAMKELPTIEEVRELLSTISGSVAEAVIAERGDPKAS